MPNFEQEGAVCHHELAGPKTGRNDPPAVRLTADPDRAEGKGMAVAVGDKDRRAAVDLDHRARRYTQCGLVRVRCVGSPPSWG
ncbi:hypothetical protein SAMN05444166_0718 [Singulisphaera sp. GP187]|uniref:hypothetical protein n=1 Tax=Singulisphaera sp. GP187 TaxID=1882752 RepID=UPI00092B4BAE|nr:hypothetical protein [Singulisphaera sp. GP187]SIN76547.1 hypothetical protein SAMN05444166_0718 [Singulisphaera sp. GP187]